MKATIQNLKLWKRGFLQIPQLMNSATFIKTSAETDGEHTHAEIDLGKSDGPPLHYHNAFSERFEVKMEFNSCKPERKKEN
jgi:hypothetical protein